eukprot:GHVU01040439.1.p2 GENE.GHVU01040439.1~~GHVU01040439.1.p2  ORF type:complete len:113 (-),score=14.26 GHVU01040439.1:1267-1605(-)
MQPGEEIGLQLVEYIIVGVSPESPESLGGICVSLAKDIFAPCNYEILKNNCNHFVEAFFDKSVHHGTSAPASQPARGRERQSAKYLRNGENTILRGAARSSLRATVRACMYL